MAEAEYWRFTVARDCQKKNTSENHSGLRGPEAAIDRLSTVKKGYWPPLSIIHVYCKLWIVLYSTDVLCFSHCQITYQTDMTSKVMRMSRPELLCGIAVHSFRLHLPVSLNSLHGICFARRIVSHLSTCRQPEFMCASGHQQEVAHLQLPPAAVTHADPSLW